MQDHVDRAQRGLPTPSLLPAQPGLLAQPEGPQCVQPVGEVRPAWLKQTNIPLLLLLLLP